MNRTLKEKPIILRVSWETGFGYNAGTDLKTKEISWGLGPNTYPDTKQFTSPAHRRTKQMLTVQTRSILILCLHDPMIYKQILNCRAD